MAGTPPQEHDTVALLVDLPQFSLSAGDMGAILHCYAQPGAYEVEFVDAAGKTKAVATVEAHQLLKLNWTPAASA